MYINYSSLVLFAMVNCSSPLLGQTSKNENQKKKINSSTGVHPLFTLESIDFEGKELLKVGGMVFHKGSLYVVTLTPDRLNKNPDRDGKLVRIDNLTGKDDTKVKMTTLCGGLFEPSAVGVIGNSIYVGTKDQIIRFDDAIGKDVLDPKSAVLLVDGTSTANFHTFTIGFEAIEKEGKTYFAGNFTTAVQFGGKRDYMIPPNPAVYRGSTFVFGPLTGTESPKDIKLEFLAGGYRTPNGIEAGPDNELYVTDNQGIFNPSNKLIRVTPGSFYGHYLHTKNGRSAAFQPKGVDPEKGDPSKMTPATLHLPQGVLARSPAQPHMIKDRKGVLAPYNGQILICDFTSGQILRASLEEVKGIWQGVAFKHTSGKARPDGTGGLTAGPNRIVAGPDGHFYIGQIGVGGMWWFNKTKFGLQRFSVKQTAPKNFNEILNVKAAEGGLEIEFLKPVNPQLISLNDISVQQWTYQPTPGYGGPPVGTEKLIPTRISFDESGKKALLVVDGLKDDRDIIKNGDKTSENSGWVVHVKFDTSKQEKGQLYTNEFWYTMHRKIGGNSQGVVKNLTAQEQAVMKFKSLCVSCHTKTEAGWIAPNLKGILGRKQVVIRAGKEVEVTVDKEYLLNAIFNPDGEKVKQFKDAVMPNLGLTKKEAQELANYIYSLK